MPVKKRKETPGVSIIGAGRLGTALAVALARKGYAIRALVARRATNARKAATLARLSDEDIQLLTAHQIRLLPKTDLILISTPDDQIAAVATELRQLNFEHKPVVLHTSGALSAEVLAPLRKKGWSTGSVHPLISVSDSETSVEGAFWSVEGDQRAVRLGKTIVRDLGGESFSIRSKDKPLYHAAAVMTSGHVTALFDVALEMLVDCGLTRESARRVLQPLLESTVHNLETKDPAKALTGTFSRGDIETVKRHLAALKNSGLADALELYQLLGKRSLKLNRKHPEITELLADDKV